MSKIFFADDEEDLRIVVQQTFELTNQPIEVFEDAKSLLSKLKYNDDVVIVTDVRMPGMDGVELLRSAMEVDSELPVILLTGHGDVSMAVECMRLGAYDFLEKPFSQDALLASVKRAKEKRKLTLELRALRQTIETGDEALNKLAGSSPLMQSLRSKLKSYAALNSDILLFGETGTGKTTIAQILHELSPRRQAPFVHINCAAIPAAMIEIELFGHEVGAFPAAVKGRFGKFEHARGGTIFLQGIEALSLEAQAKLLHVIEHRIVTPLGSNDPVEVDVRIIAASQTNLKQLVNSGGFRSDLYYRLNGIEICLPPLNDRREDIPLLFTEFVERAASEHDVEAPKIPELLFQQLIAKDWPGNLRQLRTSAENFVLQIGEWDFTPGKSADERQKTLAELLDEQEKAILVAALTNHQGKLKATFEALGISRKMLYEKMQKFDLDKRDFLAYE